MQKESKKILITGASRGIGKDIALKSKEKGYEVLGTSTTNEGVSNLRENGIHGLQLNLNDKKSVESFNYLLTQEHPDIAVLVNNAGITRDNIVLRMTEEEWMDVLNINLNGAFKISKTVLKFMLKKRWGRILNITSTSASTGNRGQANYAAAKAGIEAFSKSLAKEVGSRGITVNAIAPGYIQTDMTKVISEKVKEEILSQIPLSRFGKPEEISQLVDFLISDEASYITGQTIHINGGLYM
ncbi:MAG TPA: 3-oxoacyl-[acyl-carrier-protein] reductase [Gammaproteobacteria bacterium]|jgi:3-oxoacyl-[acyl-carrier protein] reductase|nr:3-oxoacyl-[acyl-carrier-protein] reductase [Gammaproteobacteria bacterium]HIA95422.1 3-oxoacyl-[acyl-carrier-protein] reductase [Gammaproteobacteria bacterium]HIG49466.1 3-oxoacyl-[acyl-carrier-protein] reductase [Gammaproteobacteria bacterium]HIM21407.1 3-oxoacyl-[acyl-carrier-protein] reductase [Gammaproteobacteria bacterium]HIN74267.1 3-oxoacyl-[acyl-carrier-protein] reductase [Gammaproteobacteria bacterium]|tara:strand:+ start:304 stop:1026 length:723 start_codon:yes stop_codon:yes gene_type:complete